MRIVDLSHKMIPGREEYGLSLETHNTADLFPQYPVNADTWYILQSIHMNSHCGTHIEFPYHHNRNGQDAGAFPLERLIGPGVLLDFKHKKPNELVTAEDLAAWADVIQTGDNVLFNFDCARHYGTAKSHERPCLSLEAARWLIDEKRVNMVGSDASGLEIKGVPGQPVHQIFMDHQIPIIEFAANLDNLLRPRFLLFMLALPVAGLDSCPLRLIAIEEEGAP